MQQAEDVKKVIEHCYQNTPNLVDKTTKSSFKRKKLSNYVTTRKEEKKKEIEIYRSISAVYNMIKEDLHNLIE